MAGKGQTLKRIKNELNEDLAPRKQEKKIKQSKNKAYIQCLDKATEKVMIGHYGNRFLNGNKMLLIPQAHFSLQI